MPKAFRSAVFLFLFLREKYTRNIDSISEAKEAMRF